MKEDRLIFREEEEAESVLKILNSNSSNTFTLVVEKEEVFVSEDLLCV